MKYLIILACISATACTHLTRYEQNQLQQLKSQGITLDNPQSDWERPASPVAAGALNLLPGVGNFYLASGNAGQSEHYLYGFLNLITWPVSILWGIAGAAIDANSINKRELIYHHTYHQK